jgi:hypothetical protein
MVADSAHRKILVTSRKKMDFMFFCQGLCKVSCCIREAANPLRVQAFPAEYCDLHTSASIRHAAQSLGRIISGKDRNCSLAQKPAVRMRDPAFDARLAEHGWYRI